MAIANLALLPLFASADVELLKLGRSFDEPIADPRWPRTAGSWQEYQGSDFVDSLATVSAGATLALARDRAPPVGDEQDRPPAWEFGAQGAIVGAFEPSSPSQDLFNSDWIFGLYAAARHEQFSGIVRLWHQSSHLGDEFLLNEPDVERINFMFESLSGLAAWEPAPWLRIYGGGGWIIDPFPNSYGDFFVQYGADVRSPRTFFGDFARPFAAIDVQHYDATDWQGDISLKGGLELRDPDEPHGLAVRLMVELYSGRNPNGQFFGEDVEYAGVGLQIDF